MASMYMDSMCGRRLRLWAMQSDLERLVAALPAGLLPGGRLMASAEEGGPVRYWLSDNAGEADLWVRLHAAHPRTGLWPVALHGLEGDPDRPWVHGEVYPAGISDPADHNAEEVLARRWPEIDPDEYPDDRADRIAALAPFSTWPGLAPSREIAPGAAEATADDYARTLLTGEPRLGLVATPRGADALTTIGWSGPANHTEVGPLAAVVRSWEDRFGARVVGIGFDTLELSVAAPPTSIKPALLVAAEHLAFCPDNIWQGIGHLGDYAELLIGMNSWTFWWD